MAAKKLTASKLIVAIREGLLSDVIKSIEEGSDIEEADMHGFFGLPLRTACFEGDEAIVRELLKHGVNINTVASDGPGAPLRLAQRRGHQSVVDLLQLHGAEILPSLAASSNETSAETSPNRASHIIEFETTPIEAVAPELPEEPSAAPPGNIIEFSSSPPPMEYAIEPERLIEEVDVTACYGTDTNLLTLDLMRLNEAPEPAKPNPENKKPGFWKSSR